MVFPSPIHQLLPSTFWLQRYEFYWKHAEFQKCPAFKQQSRQAHSVLTAAATSGFFFFFFSWKNQTASRLLWALPSEPHAPSSKLSPSFFLLFPQAASRGNLHDGLGLWLGGAIPRGIGPLLHLPTKHSWHRGGGPARGDPPPQTPAAPDRGPTTARAAVPFLAASEPATVSGHAAEGAAGEGSDTAEGTASAGATTAPVQPGWVL